MGRYVQYLKYVLCHKWYVFLECVKVGLYWRGLVHDLSKFRLDEMVPYARYFYNSDGTHRVPDNDSEVGYIKPSETDDDAFDLAWLRHQRRNPHHWQYWLLHLDDGGMKALVMPRVYVVEMLCDWRGAGKAQGYGDNTYEWYLENRDNMVLNSRTRELVDGLVGLRR